MDSNKVKEKIKEMVMSDDNKTTVFYNCIVDGDGSIITSFTTTVDHRRDILLIGNQLHATSIASAESAQEIAVTKMSSFKYYLKQGYRIQEIEDLVDLTITI